VEIATPLEEITCHMGSHSVTCHPAAVTFPPLTQPKLVLNLVTPEGCKAELTRVAVISQDIYPPKTVTDLIIDHGPWVQHQFLVLASFATVIFLHPTV